jgi:hypothetical protein
MHPAARYLSVALVAVVAAVIAVCAVRAILPQRSSAPDGLHELLHSEMQLSDDQQRRIAALEKGFAHDRRDLDGRLREANAAIAAAYVNEHAYGSEVAGAIDRSHVVMGDLQKLTLRHVLAMRAVLTPQQAVIFDREVVRALTATASR